MSNNFYTLNKINSKKATYNVIFGERSNGKTYATLKQCIQTFLKDGSQSGYIRRWQEDVTGRRCSSIFDAIVSNGEISKMSNGLYTGVYYWAGKFYLCTYDENRKPIYSDNDIFCHAFAISVSEHEKSTSYPKIQTIIFDEFITNKMYLNDEFVSFMNLLSTIIRKRDNVKIYLLGNTVNKYCPYFKEMGLTNIQTMKQGSIDVYKYGESDLTVAVEYCNTVQNKKSPTVNKYFAFNNPKLEMITGGAWELSLYPHLPYKYKPKNILATYFIEFSDNIYSCEVIQLDDIIFTYIHAKTTPISKPDKHFIYSLEHNPKPNYNRNILKPLNKSQARFLWFFKHDKVFYQNNSIGDAIKNYLKICKQI